MLPDSNQQSKTSSILFRGAPPFLEGMVMWSMLSRWRSVIPLTPESSSSSATDPIQTTYSEYRGLVRATSLKSSLVQSGRGVPQYRFLEIFQSWALLIQFANRLSWTKVGTLSIRFISIVTVPSCLCHCSEHFVDVICDLYEPCRHNLVE